MTRNSADQTNNTFNTSLSMDLRSLGDAQLPDDLWTVTYSGVLTSNLFVEALWLGPSSDASSVQARSRPTSSTARCSSTAPAATRATGRIRSAASAPTKNATTRTSSSRAPTSCRTARLGSHTMTFGADSFNDIRSSPTTSSRAATIASSAPARSIQGTGTSAVIYPQFLGDGSDDHPVESDSNPQPRLEHPHLRAVRQRQLARVGSSDGERRHPLGQEQRPQPEPQAGRQRQRLQPARRPRVGSDRQAGVVGHRERRQVRRRRSPRASPTRRRRPATRRRSSSSTAAPTSIPPGRRRLTPTAQAIRQVFDWYNANGGATCRSTARRDLPGRDAADSRRPAVAVQRRSTRRGVSRQFGNRGALRADLRLSRFQ